MFPTQLKAVRYKAYNLGGVFANVLVALLSLLLLPANRFCLSLLMVELLFVGFQKSLVNLIPHKTNGVPNDGYIVKLLNGNKETQKDYALYLKLYAELFKNKTILKNEYQYDRTEKSQEDELLYYNEIKDILNSLETKNTV